jgi:triosephosphate isomerase
MRRPLVAGNWKMNLDRAQAVALASAVGARAGEFTEADVAIFPPHVYLDAVRTAVAGTPLAYGAQNMSDQPGGALTGETSGAMLVDLGCDFVILGHSERRHVLGETDAVVNKKTHAALAVGLVPIVCVGELLAEREAGRTAAVIKAQFEGSLRDLSVNQIAQVVIAYEPVWAIGTGKVASPAQAEEVHTDLRKIIASRYNDATAESIRILYGGSVKAANAAELLAQPNIDGALVGGASLEAEEFLAIAAAAHRK